MTSFDGVSMTMSKKYLLILSVAIIILLALFILWYKKVSEIKISSSKLENEINELLVEYKISGASIAVVNNGKISWDKHFGYADNTSERPVTDDTLFQAASITKTLTAAAVLQILQKNHISLRVPVNNYLQRWKIPQNKFTKLQPVTIRMLLNHTAAISDPYPDGGYAYNETLPTLTQLFLGIPPATNLPLQVIRIPGEKYEYCNGCYAILQMFLEDVSSEKYPDLMEKLVLQPVAMKNSIFDNNLFLQHPTRVALPYDSQGKRYKKAPLRSPIYSTGLLWTTATDLAKYVIAIQYSLQHQNGFISQDLAKEMITPSGTPIYGLGFFIGDKYGNTKKGGQYFLHAGSNLGYRTLLIGSMDGKYGAVLLINASPEWNVKDFPQFEFIKQSLKRIVIHEGW